MNQKDPDQSNMLAVKQIYPLDCSRIIIFLLAFMKLQEQ